MSDSKFFRILGALAAITGSSAAAASTQPSDLGPRIESVLQQVREHAVAASVPYAVAIAGDRDSPEYTATLRASLNASYRDALSQASRRSFSLFNHLDAVRYSSIFGGQAGRTGAAPSPALTALDFDARYRANVALLIRGGDDADRIWNGIPTNRYQNTVAVVGGTQMCTGTVIARNAVLTAQHCHCSGANERIYVGNDYDDTQPLIRVVRSVPMRPCGDAQGSPADTAVLFIEGEFPASVEIARLATPAQINDARFVRAVGFGRTETQQVGRKMMVDIPIASSACAGSVTMPGTAALGDAAYYGCNDGYELVAGRPLLDKDTCNGDSGGPIFVVDEAGGEWLAGATSRAISRPGLRPCGDGGIYVRVDGPVRAWLLSLGLAI